jgi:serine/threonine protein kinase/tetratricopeptide (TPR) repeat protein
MPLSPGTRLGPYEIVAAIGAGGMGEVYRARDTKLHREVAIKVLPDMLANDPERLARFSREAQVLAALNHPNIAHIHGFEDSTGVPALVMELVEGPTLADRIARGPIPLDEALSIAKQIAEALEGAHERGIIHRDLKPANIKLTRDGTVKVLDFGLARAVSSVTAGADLPQASVETIAGTRDGMLLGTAPYMSPEQARAQPVDKRTDIWAFGCVLFELLTGRSPFAGATMSDTIAAILEREPEWNALPDVTPAPIGRLLRRCLEKDARHRLRDSGDARIEIDEALAEPRGGPLQPVTVDNAAPATTYWRRRLAMAGATLVAVGVTVGAAAIWRIRSTTTDAARIRSVAVLPLQNLSRDPDQEFFSDGTTEALISSLAQIHDLDVISRTSIMRYKGTTKTVPEIGRELGVEAILEGSVQRVGGSVRITAQLIRTSTDTHLWAREYERDVADVLKLEAEVARTIAQEIQAHLTPEETRLLSNARTITPDAHEAYLLGRDHYNKGSESDLRQAIDYFERAIRLQPDYAAAYAGLSLTWQALRAMSATQEHEAAQTAARRAIELGPNLGDAHEAMYLLKFFDWDWATAETEGRRALELNPEFEGPFTNYLMIHGRHAEAITVAHHALKIDPLSSRAQFFYGAVLYFARKYEEALAPLKRAIELEPRSYGPILLLGAVYDMMGNPQQALAVYDRPEFRESPSIAWTYALLGRRGDALKILNSLVRHKDASFDFQETAIAYFALGDRDRGFEWLTKAFDQRAFYVAWAKVQPAFDGIRDDPRFKALEARLRLRD